MVLFPSAMAMHGSIDVTMHSLKLKPGIRFPGMGPGKISPVQEFTSMPVSTCNSSRACKLYSYSSDARKSELSWSTARTTRASHPSSIILRHLFFA